MGYLSIGSVKRIDVILVLVGVFIERLLGSEEGCK